MIEESWNQVFAANVESALWLSQAAAPMIGQAGRDHIVIISSNAGLRPSLAALHMYMSAKHAVIGLTRQLPVGLARYGITANSVALGLILCSPSTEQQCVGYGADGQRRLVGAINTRRMGRAQDLTPAVLFFAREQVSRITGWMLSVDGDGS